MIHTVKIEHNRALMKTHSWNKCSTRKPLQSDAALTPNGTSPIMTVMFDVFWIHYSLDNFIIPNDELWVLYALQI